MTIRLCLAVGILSLSLAVAGCDVKVGENGLSFDVAEGRATDEWKRSYTLTAGGSLEIVTPNGRIDVAPADGPTVEVIAMREFRSGSDEQAQEALKNTEMIEDVMPDRVRVETPRRVFGDREGPFQRRFIEVSYRIAVPAGLNLSLKTENGRIQVRNVQGNVTINSTNGRIDIIDVAGALAVQTVNGGVNVDLPTLAGDIKVGGVNGGIRIQVRSDVDADLELHAVNGGVSVDDELTVTTTQRERQHLIGRINNGGRKISADIVNGGVRVAALH